MPSDMERAVHRVVQAIIDEGPVPQYHRLIMGRHRDQWPTLWRALDELVAMYQSSVPNASPQDEAHDG